MFKINPYLLLKREGGGGGALRGNGHKVSSFGMTTFSYSAVQPPFDI